MARGSIIVPAFNEEHRIGPLLPTLAAAAEAGYLVIVACNGCTDRTAELARGFPGLQVLEDPVPSKPRALNRADAAAAEVFPRLYVDADVATDVASLDALTDALQLDPPRAVRPEVRYVEEGAPFFVRAFFRSRTSVPATRRWLERHIEGHHVYGTNRAGRARFDGFPVEGQIMEDAFFDRMFDDGEKFPVPEALVTVPLPRSTRELVRALTRTYQGNWQLEDWLRTHRPDRVAQQTHLTAGQRIRSWLPGGDLVPSLAPRELSTALGALAIRSVASLRARRLERAGRTAAWR